MRYIVKRVTYSNLISREPENLQIALNSIPELQPTHPHRYKILSVGERQTQGPLMVTRIIVLEAV